MRYPSVTRWSVWEQGRDLGSSRIGRASRKIAEDRETQWVVQGGESDRIQGQIATQHRIAQRSSGPSRSRPWPPLIEPLTKISDQYIPLERRDQSIDRCRRRPLLQLQWPTLEKVLPHDRNKCRRARYTRCGAAVKRSITPLDYLTAATWTRSWLTH